MTALVARTSAQRRSAKQRHQLVATAHTRLMMLLFLFGAAVLLVIGAAAAFVGIRGRVGQAAED